MKLTDPGLLFKANPVCPAALAAAGQMNALMARATMERAPDLSTDEMRGKHPESTRLTLTLGGGSVRRRFLAWGGR